MKPWHQVVVPHPDIRAGKFDESVFAADLSDVIADRGPLEYRDPQTFFRKTYPTQGLVNVLANVAARLSGKGKGDGVIQIQTPFGGGKTHSLIALYHLFTAHKALGPSEVVSAVLEKTKLHEVPEVRVATFTGTEADSLRGKTPWGAIAEQLGNYDLLSEHDKERRTPGKELLHRVLAGPPTLLLLDELAEYIVKAKDYREQVIAFFQELTETVKVLPQCALVVTLPSSAPYGEEGERSLYRLQHVFGRVEAIYTPVEGEELYEVIRRRLFEDSPEAGEVRGVARAYSEMYRRLRDDVPREVCEKVYEDKLRKAYPFHPFLIDLLYERWSTYPTFQRTRGVLRLLAEVVADLYRRQYPAPLIQPAHINLANAGIRQELLKHIGNEYAGVIAADIANDKAQAKAQRIDQEMGQEYARFGVACGLASAIFFGSFGGGKKKGLGVQRLRLALLYEDIPPALVGDALRRLEEELWYLHVDDGLYSFSNQVNLNRVIVEKQEQVSDTEITKEIRAWLEKHAGSELRVTLWPTGTEDVSDTKELKLVVLSEEQVSVGGKCRSGGPAEIIEKNGERPRVYKNTVLFLAADESMYADLRRKVRELLALRAVRDDNALELPEENKKRLESKIKDADRAIPFSVLSAYRCVGKPGKSDIEWDNLGLPTVGERDSLAKRVRDFLIRNDVLTERISPQSLLRNALREEEQEKAVNDIAEAFLKFPQLPMVTSTKVIEDAVKQGVRDGVFAVKIGERVHYGEVLTEIPPEAVLVRKEYVPQTTPAPPVVETQPETPQGTSAVSSAPGGAFPTPSGVNAPTSAVPSQAAGMRRVKLRARVPYDKFSDFIRGVLMPLRSDGADLEVEVLVQARSDQGSIKPLARETVTETLKQIGAEVVEEDFQ